LLANLSFSFKVVTKLSTAAKKISVALLLSSSPSSTIPGSGIAFSKMFLNFLISLSLDASIVILILVSGFF